MVTGPGRVPASGAPAATTAVADEPPVRVGVLAVQGGVREHSQLLDRLGAEVVAVRRPSHLAGIEALVLPGGESTVIDRLVRILSLADPLRAAITGGLPVLGTCAGLILLADRLEDPAPGQRTLGVLDATVRRNAFGPQVASTEEVAVTALGPVRAAFIRAPEVVAHGTDVQVIARRGPDLEDEAAPIVGVASGDVLGIAFHPELTGDTTIHEELLRRARARRAVSADEPSKRS